MSAQDFITPVGEMDQREMSRVHLAVPVRFSVWNKEELPRLQKRYATATTYEAMADAAVPWETFDEQTISEALRPLLPVIRQMDRKLDMILLALGQQKQAQEHRYQGEVTDLSGSGLKLITTAKVPQNTLLEMLLQLPNLPMGIGMIASVVRVDQSGDPRYPVEIGASYTVLHELDRERIVRYVFQVQRTQLQRRAAARDGLDEDGS